MRPFRLSPIDAPLQDCEGRVFKRLNCYLLQADIPSERTDQGDGFNTISLEQTGIEGDVELKYLGDIFRLEKRGREENMLFVNGEMRYYITPEIWKKLQTLKKVMDIRSYIYPNYRLAAASARGRFFADEAATAAAKVFADVDDPNADFRQKFVVAVADVAARGRSFTTAAAFARLTVFIKRYRNFREEVITGGVMTFTEVLDGIILDNQHVSMPLDDDWLLPINLSVSEEQLLKVLNLFALFLQTKSFKFVHWAIPLSLSFIAALLEFNTSLRAWLYTNINAVFCYILHFICDPLPCSWRVQIYNLKPCNDIQLKVVRGNIRAIITEPAKVNNEGASRVTWLDVVNEEDTIIIERQFYCESIHSHIACRYTRDVEACEIFAPMIGVVYVNCKSIIDFSHIITLVSCMTTNLCGSLISYGPNNKVCVRGFKESILSYVKNGLPPIYKLELENVIMVKFQSREIMWGLGKVNDLEELAEPPLGGAPKANTSGPPKEGMLDLEVEDAMREDENADAQFSPGETQTGLM